MSWFEGKKVLVPFDFGTPSRAAVEEALEMASRAGDVHVIYVAPDITSMAPEPIWQSIEDASRKKQLEDQFRSDFADSRYRDISFHVVFGDPGQEIVKCADALGVDVIAMPSHGRTGLRRLLIGSVAERVLRLAHCPVLVLRGKD